MDEMRKYGSPSFDQAGNVVKLHGKLALFDKVVWLGRKQGSGSNDDHFQVGQAYQVCFIYPSNGDVELQGDEPNITTRAGEEEYRLLTQNN